MTTALASTIRRTNSPRDARTSGGTTPGVMVLMQPESYRLIPLRRRDGSIRAEAMVDVADYDWLNQWRWCQTGKPERPYVFRYERDGAKYRAVRMHRLIMGLADEDPREVDHINRNTLDNRRSNLRAVDRSQNLQNQLGHRGASSRHRGVSFHKRTGKWQANVGLRGTNHYLGLFESEEEASHVAEAFRIRNMTHNDTDRMSVREARQIKVPRRRHPGQKIGAADAQAIRLMAATTSIPGYVIADTFGITKSSVSLILKGINWKVT
jgi:hypothetical protein